MFTNLAVMCKMSFCYPEKLQSKVSKREVW